jgi:hypothetical protein
MRRFVSVLSLIAVLGIPCFASRVLTDGVGRKVVAFNCPPQRHPLLLERARSYTKRTG